MATALLAFATGGCVDPLDDSLKPQPEEPTLTFWIKVPGSMFATKAQTGDVASISPESKIYDVQVWAFAHAAETATDAEDDLPLNYVDKDNISFENTTQKQWDDSYKIQMPIPKEFVLSESPKVDLYILANWQSIFATKPQEMTRAAVRDMVFGTSTLNTNFGTTTPTTSVPSKGLPISAIYKGEDGSGVSLQFLQDAYNGTANEPLTNAVFQREIGVIELERAVGKIRFAFARTTGVTGVQITKIEITNTETGATEGLIPDQIYAFPRYALPNVENPFELPAGASYGDPTTVTTIAGTGTNPLFNTNAIAEVALPDALISTESTIRAATSGKTYTGLTPAQMTAQQYDTFLADSTSTQLVYFRESGKAISGKIYYRKSASDTEDTVVEFSMIQENNTLEFPNKTNLHRNHYWTVYAYFLGNGLYIKPVVLPWEDGTSYNYIQRGSAVVAISQKKETLFSYGWSTSSENTWYTNVAPFTGIATEYYASSTATLDQTAWSTTVPSEFSTNKYFWVRSAVTLSDGSTKVYSNPVQFSPKGEEGPFVTGLTVEYGKSYSTSVAPSSWSTTTPTWENNEIVIWMRVTASYSDDSSSEEVVCLNDQCKKNTEWYFRRQENTNWAYDWLHSQMVCAPGLNAGGVPIYANRIELQTNGFVVPLRLKLTNTDDFYLVTYNAASAEYVSWTVDAQPAGYDEAEGALIPTTVSAGGTTYFYVVPKVGSAHEGKKTEAYLVTAPTDGSGSQKLPFNAGVFPGSNENTEINFYSVSVDTFKGYYTTLPPDIKPYDKSGEVTL